MENFKVNSDLIDGTGINEDVFAALNTPDSHIFSLQRFANEKSVSLRQDSGSNDSFTTTMLSQVKFGDFVAGYTLGRSSDSTTFAAATVASTTSTVLASKAFVIAPLSASGTGIVSDSSYQLTAYKVGNDEVRIAIAYDNLPAHSSSKNAASFDYHVGVSVLSDTSKFAFNTSIMSGDNAPVSWIHQVSDTGKADYYQKLISSNTQYASLYFPQSTYQGFSSKDFLDNNSWLVSDSKVKYTFDVYDVKLASTTNSTLATKVETGTYVFKDPTGRNIVFNSDVSIAFDGLAGGETETYLINGISTTLVGEVTAGTSATNKFDITASAYKKNQPQVFTSIADGLNSNVSIAFSLNDVASSLSLDGLTYTTNNNSGTVTFSASDTTNYITLGLGNFALNGVSGTNVFGLTDKASATFTLVANQPFTLDVDGTGTAFAPVTFTSTSAASVMAYAGNSNITLAGTFSAVDASSVTQLAFTLSDTSQAKIGNYTFIDATDSKNAFVHFTSPSDITIGGVFANIYSGTTAGAGLTGVAFTLQDSTTAKLGAFTFSDTQNGATSLVKFAEDASNTITLAGSIAVSDSALSNAIFTLASDNSTYTINDKAYTVNTPGIGSDNTLAFISGNITFSDTLFPDWAQTAITDKNVTGFTAGKNINVATGTSHVYNITSGTAQILQGYYFGATSAEAAGSGTVTLSDTSNFFALKGNLNVSKASGTTLIGLDGESFTATAGSFFIADSGTVQVNNLVFVDASDGYVSNAIFGTATDITLKGAFANVYSGTEKDQLFKNFGFTLGESATAKFAGGLFSFSDTADVAGTSYVKFGEDSNTFTLKGAMSASGTFNNATFLLSDTTVTNYTINNKTYNVNAPTDKTPFSEENNTLKFISTTLTLADTFAGASTNTLILQNVAGVSVGANVGLQTGTTNIAATEGLLINGYYFGAQKDGGASGTVTFSSTSPMFALTGNLNVSKASGTELIGLNGQSFTATQGSFFIADTGSILVNALTFTDASDSKVSNVIFNNATSITLAGAFADVYSDTQGTGFTGIAFTLKDSTTAKLGAFTFSDTQNGATSFVQFDDENSNTITLAGSIAASGTFNNATFILSDTGTYTINGKAYEVKTTAGIEAANMLQFFDTSITLANTFDKLSTEGIVEAVTGFSVGANISYASGTAIEIASGTAQLINGYYFGAIGKNGASGTAQLTADKAFTLKGNLNVSKASGTELIGLNGETFTATQGSFFIQDTGSIKVGAFTFKDASDGYVSNAILGANSTNITLAGAFAHVYSGTTANTAFTNFAFTLKDSTTAKLGAFYFSDTANGAASYVQFGDNSETLTLSGPMAVSGTSQNAVFTLSSTGVYTINGGAYNVTIPGIGADNKLTFVNTNVTAGDGFDKVDTSSFIAAVTGYSAGANITAATGTFTVPAGAAKLFNGMYFGAANATASGTVSFSDTTAGEYVLTGNLNAAGVSDSKLIGLNNVSFTNTAGVGSFFLAETGTVNFNAFTFKDASDSFVSKVTFDGNGSALTLAGSMGVTGTFVNGATAILENVGSYTLNADSFTVGTKGTDAANKVTFLSTTLTTDATHKVFDIDKLNVSGFTAGSNITIGTTTIKADNAKLLGGYYFAGEGTVAFGSASDILLTGSLTVDKVGTDANSSTLVGLSSTKFDTKAGTYTFFLAEDSTGTSINGLSFNDVDDGSVTKLVAAYDATSSMGVFGAAILASGSDTNMVFTLNSTTALENGSIAFGTTDALTFAGNAVSVQQSDTSAFKLTASDSSAIMIVTGGASTATDTFALQANSAGYFQIGSAIIGNSGTALEKAVGVVATGSLASNTALTNLTIGGDIVNIKDATGSETYKIDLNNGSMSGATISQIDGGAILYQLSSATSVITTGDGIFTFTNTGLAGVTGTNTQIFSISGDANGVTFGLESGIVVSVSGIDNGATVSITDLTISGATKNIKGVTKLGTQVNNGTWIREDNLWAADNYLGYIVSKATDYTVEGIESTTEMNRTTLELADYKDVLGSGTGTTFTVKDSVFNEKIQQVSFRNTTADDTTGYAAVYGAGDTATTLFSGLKYTGNQFGVLFESGSSVLSLATVGDAGTATALTDLNGVSSSLSLTLADYALNVYTDYNVSGTGVAVTADSSTVTVDANGKSAIVGMPGNATIAFEDSGTFVINGLSTHTFTVDATAGTVAGTNSAVFALSLANGTAVTDTLKADTASALSINDLTYSLVSGNEGNFSFKAGDDKNNLNITSGVLATTGEIGSYTTTDFAFTKDAGLVLGDFTHTAVENATFKLSETSGTQKVAVSAGILNEQVASETTFFFNGNLYTATSQFVAFNANETTNTLLENSTAIGNMAGTGTHIVTIGTFEDVFTMDSGATAVLSYQDGAAYNAKWDYTSGTGTLTATNTQTFAVSDFYLTGGQTGTSTDSPYVYTASGTGILNLALNGDTATITFASGGGTRSDTAETFTFNDNPYTTTSEGLTYYIGEGSATSAVGVVYKGAGTRNFVAASDSALLTGDLSYHSNTYKFAGGLVNIDIDQASGTFTAGTGSATWTSSAENAKFYFDYNGDSSISLNEAYTAVSGGASLYALVDSASKVTGLYNAIGAGTRTGSGTYVVDVLDNASYTMADNATVMLTFSGTATAPSILANETFTSGTGILDVAIGSSFAIAQAFIDGTSNTSTIADADIFRYTASTTSKLSLKLDGTNTTISFSGFATRSDTKENAATFDFGGNAYTSTSNELTFFMSADSNTKAEGFIYNGVGTRPFEVGSETFNVSYLSDTYSVTGGTLQLDVVNGAKQSETAISGTASQTFAEDATYKTFHFAGSNGTFEYTATTGTTFSISFTGTDSSTYKLETANGAGTRTLDTQTTFAISALNDATYTFGTDATALLTIDNKEAYSETAYAGTGFMTSTGIFTAAFDKDGAYTSGTSYSYTASGSAVLSAGLLAGELTSQTIVNGAATRNGIAGSDTSFVYETHSYTVVGDSTFILTPKLVKDFGAAGSIYGGTGSRNADANDSFTSVFGNEYKNLADSATYRLTLTEGVGTEAIWSVSTTQKFDNTFNFKGTEYTSRQGSEVTLALVFDNGASSTAEIGLSGAGSFKTTDSTKTFAYDGNTYNVDGTLGAELAVTFSGSGTSQDATFVSGKGNINDADGGEYYFVKDSNTYNMGAYVASIYKANETSTIVHSLDAGTGTLNTAASNGLFNYALDGVNYKQYSDTGNAKITLVGDPDGASATFTGGSGQRLDSTTALEFTFDGNEYTAKDGGITFTLELSETGVADSVYEHATGGSGTRTITTGEFTYNSPLDSQPYKYQAASVVLDLAMLNGEGTETFVSGSATRVIEAGTTFNVAPDKFAFEDSTTKMTFTATNKGTYTLTAKNTDVNNGMGEMLFMGYNVDVVTENFTDGIGTGTAVSPFNYTSKVTSQTETYTGDGVVFRVTVAGGANTATWESGSATMTLDANRTFVFDSPTDSQSYTYTVETTAGFTRTHENVEYISSGEAFRTSTDKIDTFTILDGVSNTYIADAGAQIKLTASGTTGAEAFNAGSATFTGTTFNYQLANAESHTYTATADVTLKALVADGKFDKLFAASGVGTRGFDASETTTHDVLGDTYTVNSGTFTLTLSDAGIGTESETLTAGSGILSNTQTFHLTDYVLNGTAVDSNSTIYTYSALGADSGVTLALTIDSGIDKVEITNGLGTREVTTDTFQFNDFTYSTTNVIAYAISADSQTSAAGFLYNAIGTRDGADSNTKFVYNEDEYTAENGTMRLTVTEGKATEDMFAGTATYKADIGGVFHFKYGSNDLAAYTATAVSNLTATFEGGNTSTAKVALISATGTRLATTADAYTLEYMSDTYSAVAGSSTILFTAGGAISTATETIKEDTGLVQYVVDANKTFHNDTTGNWYEYTAQSGTTISLDLGNDSVQSFSANPFATRNSTDTFIYNEQTYTLNDGENATYLLTGTGTSLSDNLSAAVGTRTNVDGDSYTTTTLWNNVYTLTSGTYTINVANGVGSDTLTAGVGTHAYAKGDSFHYNDSNTSFIANVEGAQLGLTVDGSNITESLTAGAAFNGTDTYIAVNGAKVELVGASTDAQLTLTATDSSTLIGLTATAFDATTYAGGLTATDNLASFTADVAANGNVAIKGKLFTANAAGQLTGNDALDSFSATSVFTAAGDFTSSNPTLAGKQIGVTGDTELSVAFSTDGITSLDKLSNGVNVTDAAGATKAITDSTGTFTFNSTVTSGAVPSGNKQTFNISGDDSVTFQIDNTTGLVTGIAGIDAESGNIEITVVDTTSEEVITDVGLGQVLTRDSDTGLWTSKDVDAASYHVDLDSNNSLTVYAIDAAGDETKIGYDKIGSVTSDTAGNYTINVNNDAVSDTKAIVVTNASDKTINFTGEANVGAVGSIASGAAIQIDTDTELDGTFKTGIFGSNKFTDGNNPYAVTGAIFNVGAAGEITVDANKDAVITANADSTKVNLLADTDAGTFAINEGDKVTLKVADSDGKGIYKADLTDGVLSGLTSNNGTEDGIATGTVVIPTAADGTTFNIEGTKVEVANDTGSMTFEIKDDALVGISDVSTSATLNVSGDVPSDGLAINGDTDNKLISVSEPIKYNKTKDAWVSGDATAIDANGYLVSVTDDGTIELYYTTSDTTIPEQTTNKADYAKVFGNYELTADDAELPTYGEAISLNALSSDVKVSVAAELETGVAVNTSEEKDLALVTAEGNYTINSQEIIPSSEVTVSALAGTGAQATVSSAVTIGHDGMNISGATTSSVLATFSDNIALTDSAKVTNTNNETTFDVQGTVTFDSIAVVAGKDGSAVVSGVNSTVAPSGLTIDDKDLNVTGGDLAYTVNVSSDTALISGIDGDATVDGTLASEANIVTASTGTFKIADSDEFIISDDSSVAFTTANNKVTGIASLKGTATGNFSEEVKVDNGTVLVIGDDTVAVTANDTLVTAIDGVGADNLDETVIIANAGGASVVNADKNGNFQFGAPTSTINSQNYTVNDGDSVVSFFTSSLADYTPKVTAVSGLNDGTIAISQDEKGLVIDGTTLTLGGVENAVTVTTADSAISSVDGLQGSVNGLASGVLAQAVDSDVTINGAAMVIDEGENGTTLVASASESGFNVVTGLNAGATVYTAKSVDIMTEGEGAFTFDKNNATYTISGDSEVDFITDSQSRVSDITNFNGNLQMTATDTKVNGSRVALALASSDAAVSDVTIAGTGSGVGAISGLGNGDSVTAPAGAQVAMPGSSDSDTASALTVNGKKFSLYGDSDTVTITPGATGNPDSISGLDPGAKLVFDNTAGTYNVNGEVLTVGVGSTVVGDAEGTAHIYDPSDVDIDGDSDSVDDIVQKITGSTSTAEDDDRYVENLDSETAQALAAEIASGNTANANGNIQMQLNNDAGDETQVADFSNTTGIKKVSLEGGAQDVKFNDAGGNIAVISDDASGAKNVSLGAGGDLAAIGKTDADVNVTAGRGADTVVGQGRNMKVDLSAGGPTKLMATGYGAAMEVTGYDHNTGAGIQTTNNNIKQAVKTNTIQLENGLVTANGATTRTNADTAEGTSVVNFFNLKGLMTKVGYTHNEGGTLDMSGEHSDVVLKGNYTEGGAQRKSGTSKLMGGLGNDYALGGAGDDIDLGAGDNTLELDPSTRSTSDAGATVNQTATTGRTVVNGFNNEFGTTGDKLNISGAASVSFIGGVLRFVLGAAELIMNGMSAAGGSASDLAESADEDDTATTVSGSTNYAPININDVNTAIISEGDWIGGGDSLWSSDYIPTAYVGSGSGSGIDLRSMEGNVDMVLSGANGANSTGVFGSTNVDLRGINKVRLGSGNSTVRGTADVNNTIVAGVGASSVWGGGASDDTFIGRQTSLKSGADTFFYVNGDGADVISNFEFRTSENGATADKINVLDAVVTGASVSGQDVLVNLTGDQDRLTIKNAVGQDFQIEYGNVGSFETLTAQVNYDSLNFDGRAGYYQAVNKNAAVVASSELENAEIWLNNNRDFSDKTFVGDFKVLNASNVVGRSTLVGNSNDNTIFGSSENSSMWGGDKGGNDTLVGGAGADMFWYGKNNGSDTVTQVDENDVVNLYDVNIADVESYEDWVITNNAVSFNLKDSVGGGSLTIISNNAGFGIKFADDSNTYAINQRDRSYYTK